VSLRPSVTTSTLSLLLGGRWYLQFNQHSGKEDLGKLIEFSFIQNATLKGFPGRHFLNSSNGGDATVSKPHSTVGFQAFSGSFDQ